MRYGTLARRQRAALRQLRDELTYDRSRALNHYQSREQARKPADAADDEKWFTNVALRWCGQLVIWVGWCPAQNVFECRIEGYPIVTDIAINVRCPSSSKSLTRAARYGLAFLESQLGCPVPGSVKRPDGTYDVRVSGPA